MTWKLGLLVFIATVTLARSHLGETERELFDHFGAPHAHSEDSVLEEGKRKTVGQTYIFDRDEWRIKCEMVDGRCMRISYSKPGDWTPDNIKQVLDSNSQGAKWKETTKPADHPHRLWRRRDGSTAVWSPKAGLHLTWHPRTREVQGTKN